MGFVEFILISAIVVGLAWVGTWGIRQIPECPPIVPKMIWIVAVIIIVVMLLRALGLMGHDIAIPRIAN